MQQLALFDHDFNPAPQPADESLEDLLREWDITMTNGETTLIRRQPARFTREWFEAQDR